jgi:hypothetical protein
LNKNIQEGDAKKDHLDGEIKEVSEDEEGDNRSSKNLAVVESLNNSF